MFPCSQWFLFFNWRRAWLWPCISSICGSIMCAVQDQMLSDAPPLWYSTGAVCASKGYTRCFGCTSLYLCASSLPNLTVLQDIYLPLSVSLEWSWWSCVRWCATSRFQEQGQYLYIGLTALSLLCLLLFSISLLSFYGLILLGWGLRTDRVLTALSQPCIAGLFK